MLSVILLLSFIFVNVHAAPVDITVTGMMPAPGFSKEWQLDGKIKTFDPDNLYKHINGEAELYLPYSFEMLATAVYINRENPDKALAVNVYKMGSLLDAFGIYSRYREPDAQELNIGGGSFMNDTQLMFYKDSYFVQVAVSGSLNPEPEAFIDCARSIAKHIPGDSSKPKELDYLAINGLIPGTETYYSQSVLGYAFFKRGLAAKATLNSETVRIFIIPGRSEKDVDEMFKGYLEYLKNAGAKMDINSQRGMDTVIVADPLYKGVMLGKSGQYLVGAANLSDPSEGMLVIESILLRISSK